MVGRAQSAGLSGRGECRRGLCWRTSPALTQEALLVNLVSEAVKGDGGIAGLLEELASASFFKSRAVQTRSAPLQRLVSKGSES